ncbi:MAG TPA: class I tRNA ligase family protein, partial [Planctomycetia bacterium]|nr:class I tRNA ligase family protein [Planctomycetia bacterium]
MPRKFLVTSALPYSNGKPHVGHIAGAYLPADIYVRYLRARGDDVLFVCGSDDNGVAVTISAQKEGLTPEETVAKYHAAQERAFAGLGIEFDVYGGTHTPGYEDRHFEISQAFFRTIHEKGYFTKKREAQLYDAAAEKFVPDRYVTGTCPYCGSENANGDQCENCGKSIDPLELKNPKSIFSGTTPEVRETTHWYLK